MRFDIYRERERTYTVEKWVVVGEGQLYAIQFAEHCAATFSLSLCCVHFRPGRYGETVGRHQLCRSRDLRLEKSTLAPRLPHFLPLLSGPLLFAPRTYQTLSLSLSQVLYYEVAIYRFIRPQKK